MQQINSRMIVLAREARELTQNALARELNVTQGSLSKIEGGITAPNSDFIRRLSEVLQFPESFFFPTSRYME
ncbi:helix-turn-helix domain-containing protein [Burkholderia glumae]|uniref:helix-turn-helix domain-containing protein n=1 Tax=Burkholderia glumae TaxID=337 RepID=UPI003B987FBA